MKSVLLTLSSLSILTMGCGHHVMQPKPPVAASSKAAAGSQVALELPEWEEVERVEQALNEQQAGDYVVYRLSGSYRDAPVTLTQRVVERRDDRVTVDLTVDGNGEQQRLRLRIRTGDERRGELISVARLEGSVQRPFGTAAYEQLMNDIVLSADDNEGLLGSTGVTVNVAGDELPCTKTSYRVRVGAHEAVMATLSSTSFPWGHVGGEIVTVDGNVLYKAEIVEVGGAVSADEMAIQEAYQNYADEYEHWEE